jgi:hypothetical protein
VSAWCWAYPVFWLLGQLLGVKGRKSLPATFFF